jgi:hypothetical protein
MITFQNLKKIFADNGCQRIYVKRLSPNDNSKNQVYLGGSFEILNILPISEITTEEAGDWNKERFKANIEFSWIGDDGSLYPAPKSQLILYPKYPEVRFSGFLNKCENPPTKLMTTRLADRFLFLSVDSKRKVLGFVAAPDSALADEFRNSKKDGLTGVFEIINLPSAENNTQKLIQELKRIHDLDWIDSVKLDVNGQKVPCIYSQCGGYTLEAELGIIPNGRSEPDFLGWEIKQYAVRNFKKIYQSVITLMTPEPTSGFYYEAGAEDFIRKYGYPDQKGRPDRKNFGGIHKVGVKQARTNLTMELIGFDSESGKIRNSNGMILLRDPSGSVAASWNFASMLLHWNRKHNRACYIPSVCEKLPNMRYKYGNEILLGVGTDFQYFLKEMNSGNIYYDPGIKMEFASTNPRIKKRSQFRVKSTHLKNLYKSFDVINLDNQI